MYTNSCSLRQDLLRVRLLITGLIKVLHKTAQKAKQLSYSPLIISSNRIPTLQTLLSGPLKGQGWFPNTTVIQHGNDLQVPCCNPHLTTDPEFSLQILEVLGFNLACVEICIFVCLGCFWGGAGAAYKHLRLLQLLFSDKLSPPTLKGGKLSDM